MLENEEFIRANSYARGLGLANLRTPQSNGPSLPEGTTVVSCDGHLALAEDIWYPNFPQHLKDKAPRVWFDEENGFCHLGMNQKSFYPVDAYALIRSIEGRESSRDLNSRMLDLDAENVDKEIVFPQTVAMFFHWPDFEVREWIWRIYNEYVASLQARFPTRFFPVPVANYWDLSKSAASIRDIKKLGLKTAMLPMKPGTKVDGAPVFYGAREMDELWTAAVEEGLPISFHIGESVEQKGPAPMVCEAMFQLGGGGGMFRRIFTELVFAGVFDRHPDLKVVFAEGGINWVPGCLQDAEMSFDSYAGLLNYTPKHRPSDYWYQHCHATFMNDASGLRQLDVIGSECAMWSSDYPHNEGTLGYGRDSIKTVLDMTSTDDARRILGGNAIEVFNLR